MSNLSGKNKHNMNSADATIDSALVTDTGSGSKSNRWSFIQNDLSNAMDTWAALEKADITLSPEEEQLVRIKVIISQLKEKLEQF